MRIIKRYPNRKLYDTEDKQYITLNGIAELIREGREVQVIDHTTGEDLTAVTLTQIIFEQEKQQSGFLPRSVLTGLVRAGGDKLSTLRRTLASPLEFFHQVDEEIEARIGTLVSSGDMSEEEGVRLRDQLMSLGRYRHDRPNLSDEELELRLLDRGVPTRDELQELETRLDLLMGRLDEMLEENEAS